MSSQKLVLKRRHEVSKCLAKSIESPGKIVRQIQLNNPGSYADLTEKDVSNDIFWMKKNSHKWLEGHALNGYIFETKKGIEQVQDVIEDLQLMRNMYSAKVNANGDIVSEGKPNLKIAVMRELLAAINMKWVMQGEGPALMHERYKSAGK